MWTRQERDAGADPTCGRSADSVHFLSAWLADPLKTAAIAPSGRRLSRLITQEIGPQASPVLELGAGTGAFTHALLERGISEHDLTLVEMSPQFARMLRARFPQARVVEANAAQLLPADLFPNILAGAAISGLGLLSMHPRLVRAILSTTFSCLRPGGCLYQFTYGPRCPVKKPILNRLGLEAERIGGTWVNLPPAAVYRIRRKAPPTAVPCTVDTADETAMSRKHPAHGGSCYCPRGVADLRGLPSNARSPDEAEGPLAALQLWSISKGLARVIFDALANFHYPVAKRV